MTDYQKQALDFLATCKATMEIKYAGLEKPNWDIGHSHCVYDCLINTQKGNMAVHFYDSTHNTEIRLMTVEKYFEKKYKRGFDCATYKEKINCIKELDKKKKEAIPTEYDVLACLQKYDVGSMDNFMYEFGYEIKCVRDMTNFINTYNAVVEEYNNLCRIFTSEQMEMLREIY